ncbi:hypothetical protein PROFUN_08151 [Planoprotostelium fungivorum]|uniref:F-box domain-containing protein n=1 Tax=Planoprotostelium fungivorum TaxID=1890364 RepID=A0A2P6MQH5_9EUKA|nr:hypothetical protein PROFUN_08151 [Planoprotostelium fungivorum]
MSSSYCCYEAHHRAWILLCFAIAVSLSPHMLLPKTFPSTVAINTDMANLLPADIWRYIMLSGLSTADIICMGRVCRLLHSVSLSPHLWRMRWVLTFGNVKPDSTPSSPSESPKLDNEYDLDDLLKSFDEEESLQSETHHWRHYYLQRMDAFYKRYMDHLKQESPSPIRGSESSWIWAGTNDNLIRPGQINIIRGQIWVKTTIDTPTRNILLRLLMFHGPYNPTRDKKVFFDIKIPHSSMAWPKECEGLFWNTIPAGKLWKVPFRYEMKAMDIPDTTVGIDYGNYSECYLRASLESMIPLGAPKVSAFPMKVRQIDALRLLEDA